MKKKLLALLVLPGILTSCLGTMGLSGKVKKFNLEATEHRWGREGIFLGFQVFWVYRVCAILDLLVFNSIEFWSGENPINGKSPLVDVPISDVEKMGLDDVHAATIERINSNEAKMHIDFDNGDHLTFDVNRTDDQYTVSYLGKTFFEGHIGQNMQVANAQ